MVLVSTSERAWTQAAVLSRGNHNWTAYGGWPGRKHQNPNTRPLGPYTSLPQKTPSRPVFPNEPRPGERRGGNARCRDPSARAGTSGSRCRGGVPGVGALDHGPRCFWPPPRGLPSETSEIRKQPFFNFAFSFESAQKQVFIQRLPSWGNMRITQKTAIQGSPLIN